MKNYEEEVKKVLCKISNYEEQEIKRKTKLIELGLDSLKNVEFAIMLEDELDIKFDDSTLTQKNFATVETVLNLIQQVIGE